MTYTEGQVAAAATAIDKYRGGQEGGVGAGLAVDGLSAERVARQSEPHDDMIRVAHRAGAASCHVAMLPVSP